jgi:hypothetical protein
LRVENVGYLIGREDQQAFAIGAECPSGNVVRKSEYGALFERLEVVNITCPVSFSTSRMPAAMDSIDLVPKKTAFCPPVDKE